MPLLNYEMINDKQLVGQIQTAVNFSSVVRSANGLMGSMLFLERYAVFKYT